MSAIAGDRETGWCTFTVAGGLYGVEVARMHEVLRPQPLTRVPLAPPAVAGLLNLRGQIVPAVDLRVLFGLEAGARHGALVVVRGDDGPVALLVDEIGDVRRVAPDVPVAPRDAEDGDGLIAATVPLADRLLVVLDLDRTLERAFERAGRDPRVRTRPARRSPGDRS